MLRRRLRWGLCWLCFGSGLHGLFAQTDTAFWFAAPDINANHNERPIELKLIGLSQNATVKIYQPANASFTPMNVSVAANSVVRVDLTSRISSVETGIAHGVNKSGLKIESNRAIQAYYEVVGDNRNTDIFTLKGRNALDTLFYVPGNNLLPNWSIQPGQTYYNGVLIQASENNTVIRLRSPVVVNGRPAGTTIQVTLQRGEVYFLRSTNNTRGAKLAGTRIASNKPVAVTFYDDSVFPRDWNSAVGSCADLCGDQAVGVSFLGNTHVAIRGPGLTAPLRDIVFITAVKDSTRLQINGSFVRWMRESETYTHMMAASETVTLVETSQPVTVAQISGFGCELGMALIPNLECTGSQSAAFTRSDGTAGTTFSINLLVPAGHEKSFRINGNLLSAARQALFAFIPGTNNRWKYATINLTSDFGANANVRVSNDSVVFHCGIINGQALGSGCRFGYFSDFSRVQPRFNLAGLVAACAGEPFRLSFNVPGRAGTEWILPDQRRIQSPSLYLPRVGLRDSGLYVGLFNNPGCGIQTRDSVRLRMDSISLRFQPADAYCAYDSVRIPAQLFSLSGMAGWSWSYRGSPSGGTVFRAGPQTPGSYPLLLSGSSRLGCVDSYRDTVHVLPAPDPRINLPNFLCVGDTLRLAHTGGFGLPGLGGTRRWFLNNSLLGSDSSLNLPMTSAGAQFVALKVENDAGCKDSFSGKFPVHALPAATLSMNNACQGEAVPMR
ncbi:MAG: IgGFc-binding protein, partial [Bacteroidota bacterium]